jgi:hypothetical protein
MSFELRLKGMPFLCNYSRSVYACPVIIIALILSLYLCVTMFDQYQEHQVLDQQNQHMAAAVDRQNEIARALKVKAQQNQTNEKASVSIISMLNPVAQLLTSDIAIVSLDANPNKKIVTLDVSATSLSALMDFSARLEQIPARVELKNHTPAKNATDKWAVNATLMIIFAG